MVGNLVGNGDLEIIGFWAINEIIKAKRYIQQIYES